MINNKIIQNLSHLNPALCKWEKLVKRLVVSLAYEAYNFESSSSNVFFMASLLSLRAAVTRPDSGVHGSESNLIFAGISNFSR